MDNNSSSNTTGTASSSSVPADAGESMAARLIAYCVVLSLLDLVVVSLRFYVRLRVIRKFGPDDWGVAATMGATVGSVIFITFATRIGLGVHVDTLSLHQKSTLLKLIYVSALGYHFTVMLVKTTCLLQIRRVFPLPTVQRLCDVFLAFIAVWTVAGGVGGAFTCLPVSKNWDPTQPVWTCDARYWFWLGHGILHVVTDVLIFIMPLPLLKTLPLPPMQKIALMGVFAIGFITCAISGLRLTTLHASLSDPDFSWTSATTVFWSLAEVTCSTVCLCIPTLRPLLAWCSCLSRRGNTSTADGGGRHHAYYLVSLPSTASDPKSATATRAADNAAPSARSNQRAEWNEMNA